jgi:hypothetical protein
VGVQTESGVPWYVSLIVSWLPLITMLLLFWWIGRRVGRAVETSFRAPDRRPVGQVLDGHLREMRRASDLLERLINEHAARLKALEKRTQGG